MGANTKNRKTEILKSIILEEEKTGVSVSLNRDLGY